jgi:hypothetical protein
LSGSKELASKQRRDIRYRLNKKSKLCGEERRAAELGDADAGRWSSTVGISPSIGFNEREKERIEKIVGRVGVEPTIPAMSRRYPNQARPPALYTLKKFVAQIYVVDRC